MGPTIRRALPEDAGFIAGIILAAQRGYLPRGWFDIALDRPEPECLALLRRIAVAQARSWWHVSHFWIAEIDGEPAAALCALPSRGTRAGARAAIEEVIDAAERPAIWRRGAYSGDCWIQGDDHDWLIEHVATRPAYRGRGLMSALLDHALAEGRAAGFARASITFYIGNDAAERCYARAGFAFAEEKRHPAFAALIGAPGFRRFARAI